MNLKKIRTELALQTPKFKEMFLNQFVEEMVNPFQLETERLPDPSLVSLSEVRKIAEGKAFVPFDITQKYEVVTAPWPQFAAEWKKA